MESILKKTNLFVFLVYMLPVFAIIGAKIIIKLSIYIYFNVSSV